MHACIYMSILPSHKEIQYGHDERKGALKADYQLLANLARAKN